MGKGSSTTTQSKTYTPNAQAMGAYQDVLGRAQSAAATPYQAYGGQLTAGWTPEQGAGTDTINQYAGFASPYISEAADLSRGASGAIGSGDIQRYMDPYTQMVVDATRRQFETQNQREQSALVGNAAAKGALGGDRVSVAQASLAGEQARAQDPTIAGLYSQGYQGALAAAQAERTRQAQAAGQLAGFGISGAQAGLAGGQAQLTAGGQYQQWDQARLQALYDQYQQMQAYPYQQAQWLAGIAGSIGSQMGGTTQGEMTTPPPNPWSTVAGLATAGLGAYAKSDARAKSDIEQIGTSNDGLPIYRFKYNDDPEGKTEIGLMAQDVEKVNPGAVAADLGGTKYVNTDMATDEAAAGPRAGFAAGGFASGGITGTPWAGGSRFSWIPGDMKLSHGKTEPELDKWPAQKDQTQTDFSKYGQLGSAGFDAGKKAWGQFGPSTSQSYDVPVPSGFQWAPGSARGGAVWEPGGFAEGGPLPSPDWAPSNDWALPPSPDDQFSAIKPFQAPYPPALDDAVRAFQKQYKPETFEGRFPTSGFAPNDDLLREGKRREPEVLNRLAPPPTTTYDDPVLAEKIAKEATPLSARTGTRSAGFAPPPAEEAIPVAARPASGRLPAEPAYDEPPAYRAPGFAARPMGGTPGIAPERPWYMPGGGGDALGNALMAAGFGMMASRSPHLGVAIGEGGLTGLAAYGGTKDREQAALERDLTREQAADKLQQQADQFAATHKLDLRKQKFLEMQPSEIAIKYDAMGNKISVKAVKDPDTGQFHPIDPDTGAVSKTADPALKGAGQPAPSAAPRTAAPPTIAQKKLEAEAPPDEHMKKLAEGLGYKNATEFSARAKIEPAGKITNPKDLDENFLNTVVPEEWRDTVRGIVEYRTDPSKLRGRQYAAQLINWANRYDPEYNQQKFPMMQRTLTNFTGSGVEARSLQSHDMAVQHLGRALHNLELLGNTRIPAYNWAKQQFFGNVAQLDPKYVAALKQYNVDVLAVAEELGRVMRGGGAASVTENMKWLQKFNPTDSGPAARAALKEAAELLNGRVIAAGTRYNDAMGERFVRDPHSWMSPESRRTLEYVMGSDPTKAPTKEQLKQLKGSAFEAAPPAKTAPAAAAPAAVPAPTATAPTTAPKYEVGQVYDLPKGRFLRVEGGWRPAP